MLSSASVASHIQSLRSVLAALSRHVKLRTKLIVPYVLLTLAVAMIGTYVVTRLVTSSYRERFVNQLYEAGRVAADGVVRQEREHLATLRLMAFTEGVADALQAGDAHALESLLLPLAVNNGVELVSAVGVDGLEVLTLARQPGSDQYLASERQPLAHFSSVTQVLQAQADRQGDKFTEIAEAVSAEYLITTAPVRSEAGQLAGVIMIGTSLESLLAELKAQALADVIVLRPSGALIATTLAPPNEGYSVVELAADAAQGVDPAVTRDLRLYGRSFQALYAPLMVRQQPLGVLGVVLPSSFVVATESTSRNLISLIFALMTVAVIVLGYSLARAIARPILRLREVSQAVAAGRLDQQTGLSGSDEIADLAGAFDAMTLRLRERTSEAARLYAESLQRNEALAQMNAQLQATQQQLIHSEKMAAIGQLTAGIAHDVRNPLANIKGLAELLEQEPGLDDALRQSLADIRGNADRANRIFGDLMKFARQSKLELTWADVRTTVETVLRLTSYQVRQARVALKTDMPSGPAMALHDPQAIQQVVVNLVQNAVQAMPDGGTLRVSVGLTSEVVAIAVQDTGVGIPPENLNRVFDPFFTTKPVGEGTGLGLSVSYGIVSHHGGRIQVESVIGQGTTFTVLLPVHPPQTDLGASYV